LPQFRHTRPSLSKTFRRVESDIGLRLRRFLAHASMRHLYCHHSSSSRFTGLGAKTGWLMSTTPSVLIAISPPLDVFLESDALLVVVVLLDAFHFAAFYVIRGGDVCSEFVVCGPSVLEHKLYRFTEACHSITIAFSRTPGACPSSFSMSRV